MSEDNQINPADFVVKSRIRELLKEAGMNASSDLWESLGLVVTRTVKVAISRAQANKRKTVRGHDA
jgi:histone H3/H4